MYQENACWLFFQFNFTIQQCYPAPCFWNCLLLIVGRPVLSDVTRNTVHNYYHNLHHVPRYGDMYQNHYQNTVYSVDQKQEVSAALNLNSRPMIYVPQYCNQPYRLPCDPPCSQPYNMSSNQQYNRPCNLPGRLPSNHQPYHLLRDAPSRLPSLHHSGTTNIRVSGHNFNQRPASDPDRHLSSASLWKSFSDSALDIYGNGYGTEGPYHTGINENTLVNLSPVNKLCQSRSDHTINLGPPHDFSSIRSGPLSGDEQQLISRLLQLFEPCIVSQLVRSPDFPANGWAMLRSRELAPHASYGQCNINQSGPYLPKHTPIWPPGPTYTVNTRTAQIQERVALNTNLWSDGQPSWRPFQVADQGRVNNLRRPYECPFNIRKTEYPHPESYFEQTFPTSVSGRNWYSKPKYEPDFMNTDVQPLQTYLNPTGTRVPDRCGIPFKSMAQRR